MPGVVVFNRKRLGFGARSWPRTCRPRRLSPAGNGCSIWSLSFETVRDFMVIFWLKWLSLAVFFEVSFIFELLAGLLKCMSFRGLVVVLG